MGRPSKYPDELRERAVRVVAEVRPQYPSQRPAITAKAGMLGDCRHLRAQQTDATKEHRAQDFRLHRIGDLGETRQDRLHHDPRIAPSSASSTRSSGGWALASNSGVGQLFPGRLAGGVRLLTTDTVAHRATPDIGQARPGRCQLGWA